MNSSTIRIFFISTLLIVYCFSKDVDAEIALAGAGEHEVKMEAPIEIAAVGRVSKLGGLYDARLDKFVHLSLFNNPLKNSSITVTSNRETKLKYTLVNSLKEKFELIDISAELKLSILFGLFELEGSGQYFKDTKKSERSAKASLIQSLSTEYEEISITDKNIKSFVNMDLLGRIDFATHVVVGIQWGGKILISMEDTNYEDKNKEEVEGNMGIKMKRICGFISASSEGEVNISEDEKAEMNKFNFEIFGDILPDTVPINLIQAVEFMKNAPILVKDANNGKGKAIKYTLIPISLLRKFWKLDITTNTIHKRIEEETIQKCVDLFDNMNLVEQRLNDLVEDVKQFEPYIATSKVEKLFNLQSDYSLYQTRLRENLSQHLLSVRSGNKTINKLEEVIFQSTNDPLYWRNVASKIDESSNLKSEISFIKLMMKLNVMLINKKKKFQQFLWENFNKDIYILFYDYNQANDVNEYMNQFRSILEKREDYGPATLFASVSFEILGINDTISTDTKISVYRDGKCIMDKYELGSKINNDSNPQTWSLFDIQNIIDYLKQNPVPINFIYTQLPYQPDPKSLWPTVLWKDVTSQYSGLFFRAEGIGSKAFGTIQGENAPRVTDAKWCGGNDVCHPYSGYPTLKPGSWSEWLYSGIHTGYYSSAHTHLSFYTSSGEVRPRNMAIRVWKRIA